MQLLHNLIRHNVQASSLFTNRDDPAVTALTHCCCEIASSLSYEQIRQLRDEHNFDKVVILVGDMITSSFQRLLQSRENGVGRQLDPSQSSLYGSIAQELFVRAVRDQDIRNDCRFPEVSIPAFLGKAYEVNVALTQAEMEFENASIEEEHGDIEYEYWKRRHTELSQDDRRGSRSEMAPAEKARILRNTVEWLNDIGILITHPAGGAHHCSVEQDALVFKPQYLRVAQRFFELNREATVDEVMVIAEECAKLRLGERMRDGGFDPKWHARRGNDVGFLLRNLPKIMEQLDLGFTSLDTRYSR